MTESHTTPYEKDAGEDVVKEMIGYIRSLYGVTPTQDQIEHLWDAFAREVEHLYGD